MLLARQINWQYRTKIFKVLNKHKNNLLINDVENNVKIWKFAKSVKIEIRLILLLSRNFEEL